MKHIKLFEQYVGRLRGHKTINLIKAKNLEWIRFDQADDEIPGGLPDKYHQAVKSLGIKPENALIIFSGQDTIPSWAAWDDVLREADKLRIKYIEIEIDGTDEYAIIFDSTK